MAPVTYYNSLKSGGSRFGSSLRAGQLSTTVTELHKEGMCCMSHRDMACKEVFDRDDEYDSEDSPDNEYPHPAYPETLPMPEASHIDQGVLQRCGMMLAIDPALLAHGVRESVFNIPSRKNDMPYRSCPKRTQGATHTRSRSINKVTKSSKGTKVGKVLVTRKGGKDENNENSQGGGNGGSSGQGSMIEATVTVLWVCPCLLGDMDTNYPCLTITLRTFHHFLQHIRRKHMFKVNSYCSNCWLVFESDASRDDHQRACVANAPRPRTLGWIYECELRQIARTLNTTEKDKWLLVLRGLYPTLKFWPQSPYMEHSSDYLQALMAWQRYNIRIDPQNIPRVYFEDFIDGSEHNQSDNGQVILAAIASGAVQGQQVENEAAVELGGIAEDELSQPDILLPNMVSFNLDARVSDLNPIGVSWDSGEKMPGDDTVDADQGF